jgi:hypothetical protein
LAAFSPLDLRIARTMLLGEKRFLAITLGTGGAMLAVIAQYAVATALAATQGAWRTTWPLVAGGLGIAFIIIVAMQQPVVKYSTYIDWVESALTAYHEGDED